MSTPDVNRAASDPRGLIRESFRIEGITSEQCRSIFLDWAIGMGDTAEVERAIRILISAYKGDHPEHPMIAVLEEGLAAPAAPKRRGGWRAKRR